MQRFLPIGMCLMLSSFLLRAQEVVFTTHVPASKMGTEDAVQVRYEIQNAQDIQDFQLINATDFTVVGGPSQGQNISMMNGEVSMSVSMTYAFQPKRAGKLNFPVAVAVVKGKRIQSNVASIEVVKGSMVRSRQQRPQRPAWFDDDPFEEMMKMQRQIAQQRRRAFEEAQRRQGQQSQPAQPATQAVQPGTGKPVTKDNLYDNLFIRVAVDKNEVTVGEQVTASYKLYTRVPMQVELTKLPNLNNFWTQDFDIPQPPKPVREVLNGVEYQVFLIKKSALFPTTSGRLVLDPAEGAGKAQIRKMTKVKRKHPFAEMFEDDPFFSQAFGSLFMDDPMFNDSYFNAYEYEEVKVNLKSKPVYITVKEAPLEGRPTAFNGAVGTFTLESKINAAEITTDDIAELTLTIRGNGNIKLVEIPKLNLPNTVEVFDPIEMDTITNRRNNRITGYKTIKYRFNPQATGVLKIPSMTLAYYNADAERYEIKETPEYTLTVTPGKTKKGKHILPMDIHDIAAENTQLCVDKTISLPEQAWYWGAYLLPTLSFIVLLGYRRKEEQERKDTIRYKNKRANKVALQRLAKAEKHRESNEQTKFYEETSKAVWLYLSDKLNIPLSTLSKEMAGTLLRKRDVSQDLIDEVFLITDECELALYAPDAGDFKMNQVYSDSLKIIGALEDKLGNA